MEIVLVDTSKAIYFGHPPCNHFMLLKEIVNMKLTLTLWLEVVDEKKTRCVNYAIKILEKLICIMKGKLHQMIMGFAQNLI